jgi:5-methylcytosine-specific restriction endonuclease McrA
MSESPFFRFAYKPDIPLDANKYAKLFIRTQHLTTNNKSKEKVVKKRKKPIPATIKRLVWNAHIGEEIGKSKCLCCKITDITQLSFNCGHIIAESSGGELMVSNLMPICQNCNSSMGTKNMKEFMKLLL